jgi:RNA polymerase sigma factor (sigma-70 family)
MKQDELVFHGENVMGMCIKAASAHKRNGLDHKDLLQQAFLGATIAAQSYDPSKGTKFSTHAYMSIRAYCQQAVQANRATSGSSRLAKTLFHKLPAIQRELQAEGKPVNPHNIAEWLEANTNWSVSTSSVEDALQVVKARSVSMSTTIGDDEKHNFGDTLVSREMSQHEKLVRTRRGEGVREAMSTFGWKSLPSKQRRAQDKYAAVFSHRLAPIMFGEDTLTLEEVADSLGTSKQRVGQIETELKDALAKHVRDYI